MLRLWLVLSSAFGIGVALALAPTSLVVRPGMIGLVLMAVVALAVRRYWLGRALAAPGSPERQLWLAFGSTAIIAGHLFTSLWRIGPDMIPHSLAVHALGIDNWTLVAGGVLAYLIARDPEPRKDERDTQIATRGLRVSYGTLTLLLVVLILALGFAPVMARVSPFMVAHLLIASLILAALTQYAVQLHAYWRDRHAAWPDESAGHEVMR